MSPLFFWFPRYRFSLLILSPSPFLTHPLPLLSPSPTTTATTRSLSPCWLPLSSSSPRVSHGITTESIRVAGARNDDSAPAQTTFVFSMTDPSLVMQPTSQRVLIPRAVGQTTLFPFCNPLSLTDSHTFSPIHRCLKRAATYQNYASVALVFFLAAPRMQAGHDQSGQAASRMVFLLRVTNVPKEIDAALRHRCKSKMQLDGDGPSFTKAPTVGRTKKNALAQSAWPFSTTGARAATEPTIMDAEETRTPPSLQSSQHPGPQLTTKSFP